MPRKRSVSPGIWDNEEFFLMSAPARFVWMGVWGWADRNGIFEWRPGKWVQKFCIGLGVPVADSSAVMDELVQAGFVRRFDVDGRQFAYCVNWAKHQDCHVDEAPVWPMPIGDAMFVPNPPMRAGGPCWTRKNAAWLRSIYGFNSSVSPLEGPSEPVPPLVAAPVAAPVVPPVAPLSSPSCPSSPSGELQPPKPPKGEPAVRVRRGRTPKQVEDLLSIPDVTPEAVAVGNALVDAWRKADPEDGRVIRSDGKKLVMRLVAISARQPLFTLDVLREAGLAYVAAPAKRYKAAQYFFSLEPDKDSDRPPFYELAAAIVARRRLQSPQPSGAALETAATVAAPLFAQEAK